jgi:hypothetical protein
MDEVVAGGNGAGEGIFSVCGRTRTAGVSVFPPRTSTVAPVMLLDEPDHVVVLIGRDYDQEGCRASLLACLAS